MRRTALVMALLLVAPALASAGAREDAAAKLDAGVAAFRSGRYEEALATFQDAYATYPSDKILFNIGMALGQLGREAAAAQAFDQFLQNVGTDSGDARAGAARSALDRLAARLGRLQFGEAAAAAALTVDGAPVILPAHRMLYVKPGSHTVSAAAPGLVTRRIRVEVRAGEQRAVELELRPPPSPAVVAAAARSRTSAAPSSDRPVPRRRVWTWVAAGGALALAAGGAYAGLRARDAYADYRSATDHAAWQAGRDRVERNSLLANGLFVGAGAAAITAGVLFFTEGRRSRIEVSPSAEGGMHVWLRGSL